MNKSELIQRVSERTGMTQAQVRRCLDAVLGTVGDELNNGNEVVLPDFGRFLCVRTPERRVKLPGGRWTDVPAKERPRFKAFANIRNYSVKYFC